MKLIILALLATSALAAKLENNYLPPSNARSAGGSDFLSAPSQNSNAFARFRTNQQHPSGISNQFTQSYGRSNLNAFNAPAAKSASFRTSESYSGQPIPILRSSSDNTGDGSYRFAYETENKIVQEEEGHLENVGTDNEANTVRGAYSFQAPDGQIFTVNYIADENGFRAFGDHLPTPPPVSEAIQRSLELNRAAERYETNGNTRQSYDNNRVAAKSFNFNRPVPFSFSRSNLRSSDVNGAASRISQEFEDLNGVEVGTPDIDVNRQYLTPNNKHSDNGYRY